MPVRWELQGTVLTIAVSGDYGPEDLERAVREALGDARLQPGTTILFDGRLSEAKISKADIAWRVGWMASLRRRGFAPRSAIVVGPQQHRFGLARMLATHLEHEGMELGIFSALDEPIRWLLPGETEGMP